MDSPQDLTMVEGDQKNQTNEPFTVQENISQLNALDKAIVQLMNHASTALGSLTTQSSTENPGSTKDQKDEFKTSTDSFLTTLHEIDVKMKRQIFALEEAGIVSLTTAQRPEQGAAPKALLKPDGKGNVGNLNVGWLNSRGTRVERDMELELWAKAKEFLEAKKTGGAEP